MIRVSLRDCNNFRRGKSFFLIVKSNLSEESNVILFLALETVKPDEVVPDELATVLAEGYSVIYIRDVKSLTLGSNVYDSALSWYLWKRNATCRLGNHKFCSKRGFPCGLSVYSVRRSFSRSQMGMGRVPSPSDASCECLV